ncbi:class I SAM-dependent methyltransferase [Phyllobacterium sp. LjRoot231]|uniref:FkbM family methyltransferase n=1 Tax=Phyllobacterium sp. LjRoot231 TaxID=3342289 RepID=UPI003ED03D26
MGFLNVHGLEVPVSQSDVPAAIWSSLIDDSYRANAANLVVKTVQPNDRVLELGTGLGIICSLLAGSDGVQVWSFEANPEVASLAERVIRANNRTNVIVAQGLPMPGPSRQITYYARAETWMSSFAKEHGPYAKAHSFSSIDVNDFIQQHNINFIVMNIGGAELEFVKHAHLKNIERIFLELHDHLYGLDGIRKITDELMDKGFVYNPRLSDGTGVTYSRLREYH